MEKKVNSREIQNEIHTDLNKACLTMNKNSSRALISKVVKKEFYTDVIFYG